MRARWSEMSDGGFSPAGLRHRDKITVVRGGETTEVYNWVNVLTCSAANVRPGSVERFSEPGPDTNINASDHSNKTPKAVTHWVAEQLEYEFGIDPAEHGIDVINPTDPEVAVR